MRYRIVAVAVIFTAMAPLAAAKQGGDGQTRSDWFAPYEIEYLNAYEAAHDAGHDVGANLVDDGNPSQAVVEESTARLQAWLNPPEPDYEEETSYEEPAAAPTYSGGASNSTVMCESGGDYSANTGNGYYGGYQFDSGTWDAYGDGSYAEASDAPPAVQDAAAASVPYDAWPNC